MRRSTVVSNATLDSTNAKLERGLELYGRGLQEEAIALWREVLDDDPTNARARDYLEAAGAISISAAVAAPVDDEPRRDDGDTWKEEVLDLVRARRFDAALSRLYAERRKRPHDREVTASIQRLKEHRVHVLANALGGLDRVIHPRELAPPATIEQAVVARLVDGIASAEDVARASPLGMVRSLEVLVDLTQADLPSTGSVWVGDLRKQLAQVPREEESTPETPRGADREAAPARSSSDGFEDALRMGMEAYLARRFDEAAKHFERCLAIRPDDARARVNLERVRGRKDS